MGIKNFNGQLGQVLLLIVLLITSLMTVVMSIGLRVSQDTKLTVAQTEVNELDFAAETTLEQAISENNTNIASGNKGTVSAGATVSYKDLFHGKNYATDLFKDVSMDASAVRISSINTTGANIDKEFTSPLLKKDEQYTFYLSEYDPYNSPNIFSEKGYPNELNLLFMNSPKDEEGECKYVALELAVISGNRGDYDIDRFISYTKDSEVFNSPSRDPKYFKLFRHDEGSDLNKCYTTFGKDSDQFDNIVDKRLLIVRALIDPGSEVEGITLYIRPESGKALPPQGFTYTSEAVSSTGIKKKKTVFQSFPQIPADMFVSSF